MKKVRVLVKKGWKLTVMVLLFMIVFAYAMFEGGFVSWFLFYSFLPFVIYGFTLFLYPLKDFRVERQLSEGPFFTGDDVAMEVHLKRTFPFPLLSVLTEERGSEQLQLSALERSNVVVPLFRRNVSYPFIIKDAPRGEHILASTHLKTTDMLGLIEKDVLLASENRLLIYPAIAKLTLHMTVSGAEEGTSASNKQRQKETAMVTGVREYEPGDRLSWINWRATAKRSEIMTKEFEQQQYDETILVIDRSPHPHFEAIVSFTASFMYTKLGNGEQIGFLSHGMNRTYLPDAGGKAQRKQILTHLSVVQADSIIPLYEVIERESVLQRQRTNVTIVVGELHKKLVHTLAMYASSRRSVAVFYVISKETELSHEEKSLIAAARLRHVQVRIIRDGMNEAAFLEVDV